MVSKGCRPRRCQSTINLGSCYVKGLGIEKNASKAFEWYLKAAEQNDPAAQYLVANRYFDGNGVPQNNAKGIEFLEKSVNQEFVPAQYQLGEMYVTGQVLPKNEAKAVKILQKAANQGDADAQKLLAYLQQNKQPYYQGGDGSSIENAVIFPNAKSSSEGITLEKRWLTEKYPGYKKIGQATVQQSRLCDRIEIITSDGQTRFVYFGISNWMGVDR